MPCNRIAGAHRLYYSPYKGSDPDTPVTTYLGMTGDEGIVIERETLIQDITTDELGPEAIVDGVFTGENMTIKFVLQELNLDIVQQFLHPFQCEYTSTDVSSVAQEYYGVPGRLVCGVIGTLEAIPLDFSPAAAFTGGSATGTGGVYPGTPPTGNAGRRFRGICIGTKAENLDARARFVPVVFRCYPFLHSSETRYRYWYWIDDYTSS